MATYEEWNHGIAHYVTAGFPRRSAIFLNIDSDSLGSIGRELGLPFEDGEDNFIKAVRLHIVSKGEVKIDHLKGYLPSNMISASVALPKSVAFLGLMVLAASRMGLEEDIRENNYFTRLREVLGLPGSGRPPGLEPGIEEPLWKQWNFWLRSQDFLPTAKRGDGSMTYIEYPISQALLRDTDKDKLQSFFSQHKWQQEWDAETLYSKLLENRSYLTVHLRLLLNTTGGRRQAVTDAFHECFESWRLGDVQTSPARVGVVYAGILRSEDPLSGTIDFYLYPRSLRHRETVSTTVVYKNEKFEIYQEKRGWFQPFLLLSAQQLDEGVQLDATDPASALRKIILPIRKFWVLVPDPENADSGTYATWGPPPLGTPFMLLMKRELKQQLEDLKAEHLIEWQGEPVPIWGSKSDWYEIRHCMVVSEAGSNLYVNHNELWEAIRPSLSLSISLAGGLRTSLCAAWLEGYGPEITIHSFHPTCEFEIFDALEEQSLWEETLNTGTPHPMALTSPGSYLIRATCLEATYEKILNIISWNDLTMAPDINQFGQILNNSRISGARIIPKR